MPIFVMKRFRGAIAKKFLLWIGGVGNREPAIYRFCIFFFLEVHVIVVINVRECHPKQARTKRLEYGHDEFFSCGYVRYCCKWGKKVAIAEISLPHVIQVGAILRAI